MKYATKRKTSTIVGVAILILSVILACACGITAAVALMGHLFFIKMWAPMVYITGLVISALVGIPLFMLGVAASTHFFLKSEEYAWKAVLKD